MIIKRLAEGIRNQDWFVVSVEIMIVVVGIFIGLQVDDWNEARKEQILARQFEANLLRDAVIAVQNIEGSITSVYERIERGIFVLDVLTDRAEIGSQIEEFERGIYAIHQSTPPRVNIGVLGIILADDPIPKGVRFRDEIIEMRQAIQSRMAILEHIKEMLTLRETALSEFFSKPVDNERYRRAMYSLEQLKESQRFQRTYHGSLALQSFRGPALQFMKDAIEQLVERFENQEAVNDY